MSYDDHKKLASGSTIEEQKIYISTENFTEAMVGGCVHAKEERDLTLHADGDGDGKGQ